ncbi:NAD(P)-dependent oxidoreductase [Pseudorhodobacter turbinis]|uniref:NAD(P)-dependent oxidoreductase n=1 Tax=Pseudorhodobacter turbinis TaxID=2500533 RepID=A0A4V1E0S0_9RHOB|nr:NAD(P)-dependent oxidoreductase [Pseudorhodobacter turbinis]QCO55604.1 NAD(P)-dependent oxidoreductase [Pseudorhodobacter turbinis]
MTIPLLVMGATGRIGRALQGQQAALTGLRPIWQSRRPAPGFLAWDVLAEPCPQGAAQGVVLCLAGVIRGTKAELALNVDIGLAACRAAMDQGARHVFLASSAAVYGTSDRALPEDAPLHPAGAYGEAKQAMEMAARAAMPDRLTILRIGNIAGFDALLGGITSGKAVQLDPVTGQSGGPVRSYIGPVTLAQTLAKLVQMAAAGQPLPPVLNIAAGPVAMGDLLDAAGAEWEFGPPNPDVIARVEMDITRLRSLVDLPPACATEMVAQWKGLPT